MHTHTVISKWRATKHTHTVQTSPYHCYLASTFTLQDGQADWTVPDNAVQWSHQRRHGKVIAHSQGRPLTVSHTRNDRRTVGQLSYCHLGLSRSPPGPGNSTQLSWIQCGKGRGQSRSGFPYQHSCLCDCHVVFLNACGLNFSKLTGCTLMLTVLKNWCYILKPILLWTSEDPSATIRMNN